MKVENWKIERVKPYEKNPIYCDVIVKRWEEFTGKKAELLQEADCG